MQSVVRGGAVDVNTLPLLRQALMPMPTTPMMMMMMMIMMHNLKQMKLMQLNRHQH